MELENSKKNWREWLLPVAAALLCMLLLQNIFARKFVPVADIAPVDGVLDITGIDFSQTVFQVSNNWDFYPGALWDSADFAAGRVGEKAGQEVSASDTACGTYRLRILAEPNQYYTICSFSLDYASRVFVNGSEVAVFGKVSESAQDFVPQVGYMTIPLFSGPDGEIEIIYQYANYVHEQGGYIQPTYLSTPQNMENYKAAQDLVSLTLSGGLVLLALYFLITSSLRRKLDFLCLALCCLAMALRDQNFYNIHLLPQNMSWYVKYRVFIFIVMLLPASILLLLKCIYSQATRNWPLWLYLGIVGLGTVLIYLLPTQQLVKVSTAVYYCSIPYLLYLIYGVVRYYIGRGRLETADILVLMGFVALVGALVYDALLTGQNTAVTHYGTAAYGMLCFAFLNATAINLQIRARAVALAESRSRSRMLEQMNRLNMDFFRKVAHELKTPLTVISGYAQLTGMELNADHLNREVPQNLRVIQQEAQRLADLVTQLMQYSRGQDSSLPFGRVAVEELLENVRAVTTPICLKNGNTVQLENAGCTAVHGSLEMLLQIFLNLVINASRSTQNGTITVQADPDKDAKMVLFRVRDTGSGIAPEVLPHIFEQGYSASGGNGLGLAICREAVEAHGGRIWVESTGEKGTVFAFTIPREGEE